MEDFSNTVQWDADFSPQAFVPSYETNPAQDGNGQQGTTGLVVPLRLQTEQHQLNKPKSPKELRRSGPKPKATLTQQQKKENRRKSDKKYRQKQKDNVEKLKRDNEELRSMIRKLMKRPAKEESSGNEGLKNKREKPQYVHQMLVSLPAATVPISSFGPPQFGTTPPQLGASSSTLTEFAPPTSIAPNLTTVFPRDLSNSRLMFCNSSSTHLPLKLNPSNFLAWGQQLQPLPIGYGPIGLVDGSNSSPPAKPVILADRTSLFNSSPFIANDSSFRVKALEKRFQSTTKGSKSVSEFLFALKKIADDIARDSPISMKDFTNHALNGLGPEFQDIAASIWARETSYSFEELHDRLLAHEESLQRRNNVELPVVVIANVAQRNTVQQAESGSCFGSSASNRRRSRQNTPPHGKQKVGYNTQRIPDEKRHSCLNLEQYSVQVCQFCDSNGHVAKSCPKLATHPSVKCVTSQPNDWLFDIGAKTHATNDFQSLVLSSEYEGTDSVVIADVIGLPISHVVKGSMYGGVPTTRPQ